MPAPARVGTLPPLTSNRALAKSPHQVEVERGTRGLGKRLLAESWQAAGLDPNGGFPWSSVNKRLSVKLERRGGNESVREGSRVSQLARVFQRMSSRATDLAQKKGKPTFYATQRNQFKMKRPISH